MNNRASNIIRLAVLAVFLLILGVPFVSADSPQAGTTLSLPDPVVSGGWERVYDWTINKVVDKPVIDMFKGDSETANYTIKLDRFVKSDRYYVEGDLIVTNGGDRPTENLKIVIDVLTGSQWGTVVTSQQLDISDYPVLGKQETHTYHFKVYFDGALNTDYKVEANVTITNHSGHMPGNPTCPGTEVCAFGPSPRSNTFRLPNEPTSEVNATISVTDTMQGNFGPFSDDAEINYSRTFTCGETNTYGNTATIIYEDGSSGPSSSASVQVNCYDLTVTKYVDTTTFERTWSWTVDKVGEAEGDSDSITLQVGQKYNYTYTVSIDGTASDSDHYVAGHITIKNNAPQSSGLDANLTQVVDSYSNGSVTVVCSNGLVVPAGGSIDCTYSGDVNGSGTNTATATLQNVPSGTTDFSSEAVPVNFVNPTTITDECVTLVDSLVSDLGQSNQFCASSDPAVMTFSTTVNYSYEISYPECGPQQVINTASITTNDTGTTSEDTYTVDVDIPCVGGCSLTQGYWKTHSANGPAPYDATWEIFDDSAPYGDYQTFFLSGQNYWEVLWTAPAGNAYYNLAHQYIAAVLNGYNGADTSAVDDIIAAAETLFNQYTPTDIAALKGKKAPRPEFVSLAGTLASYNEGTLSIPHCDEDSSSSND